MPIPNWSRQAGLHADRLSINVELPTARGLTELAPEKSRRPRIEGAMGEMKDAIDDGEDAEAVKSAPRFAPRGNRRR